MLLIDKIAEITGRVIALNKDVFVYLEDKKQVEASVISEAERRCAVALEEKAESEVRSRRDERLQKTLARLERHRYQLEIENAELTDNTDTYQALLQYAQKLRDIPEQAGFPHSVVWPVAVD